MREDFIGCNFCEKDSQGHQVIVCSKLKLSFLSVDSFLFQAPPSHTAFCTNITRDKTKDKNCPKRRYPLGYRTFIFSSYCFNSCWGYNDWIQRIWRLSCSCAISTRCQFIARYATTTTKSVANITIRCAIYAGL